MSRVPVLAENRQVFKSYLDEHGLNPNHFDYVTSPMNIRGRRGVILLVGRWWRNDSYRNYDFAGYLTSLRDSRVCSIVEVKWHSEEMYSLLRS